MKECFPYKEECVGLNPSTPTILIRKEITMKAIYKYKLPFEDIVELELPKDARVLSAINQHEDIVIYALVDTKEAETRIYTFRIIGTGHAIDKNDLKYYHFLNSVSLRHGALIFHVFYL